MHTLVLIRHGESLWNKANRFTGWMNIDLSPRGRDEARRAGRLLKEAGFIFDVAYTSVLTRAIRTDWIVRDELDQLWIPIEKSWRLNEKHYGTLQGLNKAQTVRDHGAKQTLIWRRSYDVQPPPLDPRDRRHPDYDPRYRALSPAERPATESLKDTVERFLPYWLDVIAPAIKSGKRVLITAHGNSLRALVKYLEGISDADIVDLNIPTGIPLVYELDDDLRPTGSKYLGDPEAARRAAAAVANQASGKKTAKRRPPSAKPARKKRR